MTKSNSEVIVEPKDEKNSMVVIDSNTPGVLTKPTCKITLNTRISRNELIDAAIYDLEEKLIDRKEFLSREIDRLELEKNTLNQEFSSEKIKIAESYKIPKVSNLIKELQKFITTKVGIKTKFCLFSSETKKVELSLDIVRYIYEGDYSKYEPTGFGKSIIIDATKKLVSLEKDIYNHNLDLHKSNLEIKDINTKLSKLPLVKKKINAELTKSILLGNYKQTDEIIDELHKIITKRMADPNF